MKYIAGRQNLAVTVFVPYDCHNNCKFCTSKKEYADGKDFSIDKIISSLEKVLPLPQVRDLVITGGEPFANLEELQKLIDLGQKYCKNVYINTTLPVRSIKERQKIMKFLYHNASQIDGLNVSRHIIWKNKLEDDTMLEEIPIPIKINSVLFGYDKDPAKNLITIDKIKEQVDRYKDIMRVRIISFRGDYRQIKDMNDLKSFDSFCQTLMSLYDYQKSGGCLVCNDDRFETADGFPISYHRGKELSSVICGNNFIVNDIIVKQNGEIHLDWLGNETENVEDLINQWTPADRPKSITWGDFEYGSHFSCGYSSYDSGGC